MQKPQRGTLWKGDDGWWRGRFRMPPDEAGKRRQREVILGEYGTAAEAHTHLARIIAFQCPPLLADARDLRWSTYCDRYDALFIAAMPAESESTRRTLRSILNVHIRPSFDKWRSGEINVEAVQQWISAQFRDNVPHDTVLQRFKLLRVMLNRGKLVGSPTQPIRLRELWWPKRRSRADATEGKDFRNVEIAHIFAEEPSLAPLTRLYLETLRWTGLRGCEACGLTWRHVNFRAGVIEVRFNAARGRLGPLKSGPSKRDVAMGPVLAPMLEAWQRECPSTTTGWVFPDGGDRPLSQPKAFRALIARLHQVGIEPAGRGLHGFRHAFGFNSIEAGVSITRLRDMMGHTTVSQTQAYLRRTTPIEQQEAANLLAVHILGPKPEVGATS
jgi:integrase